MTDYGIVFSGGGALGAWEVGCLKAILAHHENKPPAIVTGASAGALNAAGICAGFSVPQLQELWQDLRRSDVYKVRDFQLKALGVLLGIAIRGGIVRSLSKQLSDVQSVYDTEPLRSTLKRILNPRASQFQLSQIAFAVSTTNLTTGKSEVFYQLPGGRAVPEVPKNVDWKRVTSIDMLVQALMGTTALPILFPPMEGYFDGGVLLNQPISPATRLGGRLLYVLIPSSERLGATKNLFQIGSTVMTTWLAVSLKAQIERVRLQNDIREYTKKEKTVICVIRPPVDLGEDPGVGLLSFGDKVDRLIKLGEQHAKVRLQTFDIGDKDTWY